jgi:hypothetical protein
MRWSRNPGPFSGHKNVTNKMSTNRHIDIDLNIKAAREAMKAAAKAVSVAKANQRNEMRRKQRLMKKAAGLSSGDLERIAVMKRCGLFDPTIMMAVPRSDTVTSEAANPPAASVNGTNGSALQNKDPNSSSDPIAEPLPDPHRDEREVLEQDDRDHDDDLDDP